MKYYHYYYSANALANYKAPSFSIYKIKYLDTVQNDLNIGNADLIYPIGSITADEVIFAGATINKNNFSYYLYNGYNDNATYSLNVDYQNMNDNGRWNVTYGSELYAASGDLTIAGSCSHDIHVRPVINLKANTSLTVNDTSSNYGTWDNPYIVVDTEN
ncbi:MAG: hypothetical protein E7163_01175 [Firmicutes bacterium]|nr:hypothetical protein [Bacillota bacterium]